MSGRPREYLGSRASLLRTPGGLLKRLGRALLWVLVVVLLLRGLAGVLEPRDPGRVVQAPRPASIAWPDDEARAFAAEFARAYLSFRPGHADQAARAVQAFAAPELAGSIVPEYDGDAKPQTVVSVVPARSVALDAQHALVTVAVAVDAAPVTRYLTVPVARDATGGLVVSDLPSFAAPPARASVDADEAEPLPVSERAAIEPVVSRFLAAYVAGDPSAIEYLVPAGVRIAAPGPGLEFAGVASLELAAPSAGRRRIVLATVRARDQAGGGVFSLRYRLALVREDRWYVAAINEKGG
jgi:hypothetical protein